MLNEGTLVLEGVTLAEEVQLVVQVLVDLSGGAVLDQKAAEDTETAHPEDLAVFRVSNYSMCVCSPHGGRVESLRSRAVAGPVVHTWAYGRPWYPSSYRNHGGDQFVERRSAPGRGHASAW